MNFTFQKNSCEKQPYTIGLDIIRIIAMFLVIMVHSTSFYGFRAEDINSLYFVIVGAGRYLSFACVPLFMLLTGYLSLHKKPDFSYYVKFLKILTEFFLCAAVVALFYSFFTEGNESFLDMMISALSFNFPKYSWYIKMYVGLFLLAPFLNYIINSISNKQAILLIAISLLIFSNPYITNYWQSAYPLMYYFVGAIIRKTQFSVKKIYIAITLFIACFVAVLLLKHPIIPCFNIENHNNLICIIISVALFLIFYDVKWEISSDSKQIISKITRLIANTSMSTFLISVIFETQTELLFDKWELVTYSQRLPYLLYLTPVKFILSVACALPVSIISTVIFKLVLKAINKIKSSTCKNITFSH